MGPREAADMLERQWITARWNELDALAEQLTKELQEVPGREGNWRSRSGC